MFWVGFSNLVIVVLKDLICYCLLFNKAFYVEICIFAKFNWECVLFDLGLDFVKSVT